MSDKLWCDVETGGCWHHNEIIQIAGCIEHENNKFDSWFNFHVKPYDFSMIEQQALDVNGYTLEDIQTFEEPETVMEKLLKILQPYENKGYYERLTVGGYNVVFDINMLMNFFARVYHPTHELKDNYWVYYSNYYKYVQNRHIDVMQLVPLIEKKIKTAFKSYKLEDIYKSFFPNNPMKAHDALSDIQMTIKLHKTFLKILELE